jgi:hypothetical protein
MEVLYNIIVDMLYDIRHNKGVRINGFDVNNKHLFVSDLHITDEYMIIKTLTWNEISKVRAKVSKKKIIRVNPIFGKLFNLNKEWYYFTDINITVEDQSYVLKLKYVKVSHLNIYFDELPLDITFSIMNGLDVDQMITFINTYEMNHEAIFRLKFPVIYAQIKHLEINLEVLISFLHMSKISDMIIQFRKPSSSIIYCKYKTREILTAVDILSKVDIITYYRS